MTVRWHLHRDDLGATFAQPGQIGDDCLHRNLSATVLRSVYRKAGAHDVVTPGCGMTSENTSN